MTDYPKFASITTKEMETVQERGRMGGNFCAHIIFKKLGIKCYLSAAVVSVPVCYRSTGCNLGTYLRVGKDNFTKGLMFKYLARTPTWVMGSLNGSVHYFGEIGCFFVRTIIVLDKGTGYVVLPFHAPIT